MSDLAARHLIQQGATTLLVSNRTEARAEAIADALRTPAITTGVIPFEQLHEQSHRADIIITSTGAASQIFTAGATPAPCCSAAATARSSSSTSPFRATWTPR